VKKKSFCLPVSNNICNQTAHDYHVTDETAPAGGIFKVELIYAVRPQKTRQAETKAGLTMSHDIHIASPKHLHEKSVNNEV